MMLEKERLSDWILSRKISIKSMARHFAGWKLRLFQLQPDAGLLRVESSDPKVAKTIIPLHSSSIRLDKHYYSSDKYHSLCLKYYDKVENCVKEIVMKFEDIHLYNRWYSVSPYYLKSN